VLNPESKESHFWIRGCNEKSAKSMAGASLCGACGPSTGPLIPVKRKADGTHMRCPRQSFWNIRCACVFSYVPDALIINHIFSFLTHTELAWLSPVCKRWRFLSSSKVLWRTFEVSTLPHNIPESSITDLLIKHADSIQCLKLCDGPQLSHSTLSVLPHYLTKLKVIHLCNLSFVQDQIVKGLIAACPMVSELYLGGCSSITDAAFEMVPVLGRALKCVTLRGCRGITSAIWDLLPSSVVKLNLAECSEVCYNVKMASLQKFVQLESLNLHGVDISDEVLEVLCASSKKVTQLAVSSANPFLGNRISDSSLKHISTLSSLTDLNIMGARHITDQGIFYLSLGCTSLVRLSLGFCIKLTDSGLNYISRGLTSLTHLGIFQCPLVTDDGIAYLSEGSQMLQILDIRGCINLTGASITCFIKAFPSLKVLTAGLCRNISQTELDYLQARRGIEIFN
jgi:hypothetical protein